jgi:hypothetical protein
LFEFDSPDEQCREGRRGTLCGKCDEDRGVTLDLQSCSPFDCTIGLVLFILVCCTYIGYSIIFSMLGCPLILAKLACQIHP